MPYPPAIWHRPHDGEEVFVNTQIASLRWDADGRDSTYQSLDTACPIASLTRYLGQCLGYAPASAAEGARADQIAQTAVDYWAEGRTAFHPLDNSHLGTYSSQRLASLGCCASPSFLSVYPFCCQERCRAQVFQGVERYAHAFLAKAL